MGIQFIPSPGQTRFPPIPNAGQRPSSTQQKQNVSIGTFNTSYGSFANPNQLTVTNQLSKTSSRSPSNSLRTAFQILNQLSQYAELQRHSDKQSGIGLFAGANQFAAQVSMLQNAASHANKVTDIFGQTSSINPLTSLTQSNFGGILGQALGSNPLGNLFQAGGGFGNAITSLLDLAGGIGQRDPVNGALNGASFGSYVGSIVPGVGTLIGGALGAVVGGALGFLKSGKHKDQIARDQLRSYLQAQGFIDSDYQVTLADGSLYNIGYDGRHQLENLDGSFRRAYETDPSNPLTPQIIGWLNPLAELLAAGDDKLRSDLTGYLTNAVLSNTSNLEGAWQNVIALYDRIGAPAEEFMLAMDAMLEQQRVITQEEHAAYRNGLQTLVNFDPNMASS